MAEKEGQDSGATGIAGLWYGNVYPGATLITAVPKAGIPELVSQLKAGVHLLLVSGS